MNGRGLGDCPRWLAEDVRDRQKDVCRPINNGACGRFEMPMADNRAVGRVHPAQCRMVTRRGRRNATLPGFERRGAPSVRNWSCQWEAQRAYGAIPIGARDTLATGSGRALCEPLVMQHDPRMWVDIQPDSASLCKSLRPRINEARSQCESKTHGISITTHEFLSLL